MFLSSARSGSLVKRLLRIYKQKVGELCATSPLVLKRFLKVANMMEEPLTLLYPDVMFRVLLTLLR